jgi:hypothetical protein
MIERAAAEARMERAKAMMTKAAKAAIDGVLTLGTKRPARVVSWHAEQREATVQWMEDGEIARFTVRWLRRIEE